MEKITRTTLVKEVLEMDPGLVKVLLANGLNCQGCPGAQNETLEEAAFGHDVELERLLELLNRYMENRQP